MLRVELVCMLLAASLPATTDERGITSEQAERIINELSQIRELLTKQAGISVPTNRDGHGSLVRLELRGELLGSPDAPVTVVEFSDYQCSYCRRFHEEAFAKVKANYIDTGQIRFYVRDYPVSVHEHAMEAAQIARCAAEQKQFWAMDEWLRINTTTSLDRDALYEKVAALGLNRTHFEDCLATGRYSDVIQQDIADARKVGVRGTPTFIIGKSSSDKLFVGELVTGAIPYEALRHKIQELLAQR